jgi:hypothetical protein
MKIFMASLPKKPNKYLKLPVLPEKFYFKHFSFHYPNATGLSTTEEAMRILRRTFRPFWLQPIWDLVQTFSLNEGIQKKKILCLEWDVLKKGEGLPKPPGVLLVNRLFTIIIIRE